MKIKLLGVRGSIPTPLRDPEYRDKLRAVLKAAVHQGLSDEAGIDGFLDGLPPELSHTYGGNTTCAAVYPPEADQVPPAPEVGSSGSSGDSAQKTVSSNKEAPPYIIDCGTGLRVLGDELMDGPCGRGEGKLHIFLTHTHWDHIQGIPFFKPLYIPGNEVYFYSPYDNLESRLTRQQIDLFFPMPLEKTASQKHFVTLREGEAVEFADGTLVDYYPLRHPGGSFAYRFRRDGKGFIFATDCEFTGQDLERDIEDFHFFRNADLLVLDAQYTLDDHFQKFDWGHTSITMAVNIACRWAVKNLVLTHHEPAYSDERISENFQSAVDHKAALRVERPHLHMAREGLEIYIQRGTDEVELRTAPGVPLR